MARPVRCTVDIAVAAVSQTPAMEPTGPKIAAGRDSEIFEHGPGKVLRRVHDGRSMVAEAEIMRHVRSRGYPCPEVHDAGDGYLVMERLEGPTMMTVVGRPPFPLRRSGRQLAELHERLHRITAPAGVRAAPLAGDRVLHGDLHPMNVVMTADGPVVIDWSNASAGDPAYDVADAWVLLACATPPTSGIDRVIVPIGRRILLHAFLHRIDRAAAERALPAVVARRLADPHMRPEERDRMRELLARAPNGSTSQQ
jgi:aminoglycoside phosphotransferase (APT) family kinase protein